MHLLAAGTAVEQVQGRRIPMSTAAGDLLVLVPHQRGHFLFESGHHSALWLDLERLCLRPRPVEAMARQLAERLARHGVEIICGPLVEGAFVALTVASALELPFTYTERVAEREGGLYPYRYRLPRVLHDEVRGRRAAIVNDVISAGSAVGGTAAELEALGANVVAIATLLVLGDWTAQFTGARGIAVEALATMPNPIWTPADCPLCARGEPLVQAIR
ncbi:MAG TPA: orotate phosphoribosyltransferase [Thermoanaerobaculia bacterium]|nr:orotate phosphoribosyltransferase [Thermoanaerobaculia bacterium]